jgi:beta-1,4-N-acetylglucosaminyltransferase
MNIAIISSEGGHLGQMKLIFTKKVLGKNKVLLITESSKIRSSEKDKFFQDIYPAFFFKKDELLSMNPYIYLKRLISIRQILKKNKISLVITNGAQISIPAVIAARSLGIKSIFIETIIRVKSITWTAKFCYYLVEYFFVQHKDMINKYGKKAQFIGGII